MIHDNKFRSCIDYSDGQKRTAHRTTIAAKQQDVSPELLIHPGETIADLLLERGLTQKESAQRLGVSPAFLSDVIRGKKDISEALARGLELAFDVPKTFWLNLQANYDAELLAVEEEAGASVQEKTVLPALRA